MARATKEADLAYKRRYRKNNRHIIREQDRRYAMARFRAMGLEPRDLDDQKSDLECFYCGMVTGRISHHPRHEDWCTYADVKIRKNASLKEIGHYENN